MARVNRFGFLAIALTFHLVYIFSIFDIYFVSPIVTGMREFEVERPESVEAPAKRLVLYVGTVTTSPVPISSVLISTTQVTVFGRTKLSNHSQNHTQKTTLISYPDLLPLSCAHAY